MEFFILYLLTSISKVSSILAPFGVVAGLSIAAYVLVYIIIVITSLETGDRISDVLDKAKPIFLNPLKKLLIVSTILWSVGKILPTERDLAIIIGGGVTYQAITSDKGKEIGGKVVEIIMRKVDELLESDPSGEAKPSGDATPEGIKKGVAPNVELDNNIEYKST